MSSCSSSLVSSSRTVEIDEQRAFAAQNAAEITENRIRAFAAQNAAEAMLSRPTATDSETSSARNFGTYGSINARQIQVEHQYPEINAGNHNVFYVSDDIVSGSRLPGGRMSPVRRFFCLLVTFDVLFSSLLWVITVIVTGRDIKTALYQQTVEYTIHSSMFDIVVLAFVRFLILILLYALMDLSHWWPVAFTTFSTSAFLIAKVFEYEWTKLGPITFDVTLVLLSFILAWGETWFLDFRVLPLEMKAREIAGTFGGGDCERRPLLGNRPGSMLQRYVGGPSLYEGSVANYYSPMESPEPSDDEGNDEIAYPSAGVKIPKHYNKKKIYSEKDAEYKRLGEDILHTSLQILDRGDWKREKSIKGDLVESKMIGGKKVFKLTGQVKIRPEVLLEEMFYRIESSPSWNPTLKECKTLQVIDSHTDISHQVCSDVGGGISPRDFVNLRHWQYVRGVYVAAAAAISHPTMPDQGNYIRGENGPGCFAISACDDDEDCSTFQWLLNTDLKGWIPKGVIESTLTTVQLDYLKHLRKRVDQITQSDL